MPIRFSRKWKTRLSTAGFRQTLTVRRSDSLILGTRQCQSRICRIRSIAVIDRKWQKLKRRLHRTAKVSNMSDFVHLIWRHSDFQYICAETEATPVTLLANHRFPSQCTLMIFNVFDFTDYHLQVILNSLICGSGFRAVFGQNLSRSSYLHLKNSHSLFLQRKANIPFLT